MFEFLWKPNKELIDVCSEDDDDQLMYLLDNMIIKENKDPMNDISKEQILNTFKNRWLIKYCVDNSKWKTLKVLIDYRILTCDLIKRIEKSIATNYNILTNDQIDDLKNLLIAIKIYRNYNSEYVNPTTYESNHPYCHLLYVGGYNNSHILSEQITIKLDTILVNNLIDKLFDQSYKGLYINVDINKKADPIHDKLEHAFCNNVDDCITLFNTIHSIDMTKWKSPNILNANNSSLNKKILIYYGIPRNRKQYYKLSKPILTEIFLPI
jgi:hypothetical protein